MTEDAGPVTVSSADTGAVLVMRLSGGLDAAATAPAGAALLRASGRPAPDLVVLDLTNLLFFSAAAVYALDQFAAACALRGIRTRLVADIDGFVHCVIRLAELDRRIPVFASVELAVAARS